MSDRYDENLFLGFIEGDLSPTERLRFERQLAVDPNLRQLVEQVQLDRQELRQTPVEAAPPEIMETVNQALERAMLFEEPVAARGDQALRQQRLRLVRWSAYAAVAALALVSTGVVVHVLMQDQLPQPTGSHLTLNGATERTVTAPTIDTVAMLLNTGRGEVGSGGQFAVLISDSESGDANRAAVNAPAAKLSPGFHGEAPGASVQNTAPAPAPTLAAKSGVAAGPGFGSGAGSASDRLDEAKRRNELANGNVELRDLKDANANGFRSTRAQRPANSTTLVIGGDAYGRASNISKQRIEVVAQNTLRTQTNLVLWCTNNGSTLVADSTPALGDTSALNSGNTLASNGGNFNGNSDGNSNWNSNSNAMSNDPVSSPARFQNNLTNNAASQGLFGNTSGNTTSVTRFTVVVRPEKVSELVHYMNANGDTARLADFDKSGMTVLSSSPANGPVAAPAAPAAGFGGRRGEGVAAASPPVPEALGGTATVGGGARRETEVAAAPVQPKDAALERLRAAPLHNNLEEKIGFDRRLAHEAAPEQTQLKQAITGAQTAYPYLRAAEGQAQVAAAVGSLAQTNWASILMEQLPLDSSLELPETPASAPTSLEVPVVITEDAAEKAK